MKKRYTDEQAIPILRECENREVAVKGQCNRHIITEQTFYRWRNKFDGMYMADACRLKELGARNAWLKWLVAEQRLGQYRHTCCELARRTFSILGRLMRGAWAVPQ